MSRRLLSCAVLAIAASACGDAAPASNAPGHHGAADAKSTSGAGGSSAGRERAAAPVVVTQSEVEAFVAAWSTEEDHAICERLVAEFAARGDAALAAAADALRWYPSDATWAAVRSVFAKFGAKGWLAGARALPGLQGHMRSSVIGWLREQSADWRFDPLGPDVCRALLAALDATSATDEPDRRESLWAALAESRPAGGAIAADLANRLVKLTTDEREHFATVLEALGSDAAAAAPVLLPLLRSDDAPVRELTARVLGAIGSADPSILPALRDALAKGTLAQRVDVCRILASWADAAAAAGPDLVALVSVPPTDDEERDAANAALDALRSMRAVGGPAAVAILEAQSKNGIDLPCVGLFMEWAKDPAFAAALVRAAPTLSPEAAEHLLWVLADAPGTARVDAASRLLGHAAPLARAYAAAYLIREAGETASPRILALLDDPAAPVRAYTARALAEANALPRERVRAIFLPLREDADDDTRVTVITVLAKAQAIEAADTEWLIRAAHDEATRHVAVHALATRDGPLPVELEDIAPALARAAIEWYPYEHDVVIAWLVRIPRGIDALLDEIRMSLNQYGDQSNALGTVKLLGPRAAPLREYLVALHAAADEEEDSFYRDELDRALAAIDGNLDRQVVDRGYIFDDEIADLLRQGAAGRLALVLAAGYDSGCAVRVLEHRPHDAAMQEAVRVAATRRSHDPETDSTEDTRRKGAARLASILPPAEAAVLLARLASDPLRSIRGAVAAACNTMSASDAGAVPVGALATLLALRTDDDGDARFLAARAASRIGARAADLLPRLREVAVRAPKPDGVMAAIAAWRIGGGPDDALPGVRRAIDGRDQSISRKSPWAEIGKALSELPLDDTDLPRLLRSFDARLWDDPERNTALIRGLTRFGARAASAVPTVRRCLATARSASPSRGSFADPKHPTILLAEAAARLLLVVGPAARDALPDLRFAASVTTDPSGVLRDAVRRIESAPR